MTNIDYQRILNEAAAELKDSADPGEVATYIPELRNVDASKLGAYLVTVDNKHFGVGDSHEKFSIQRISKVLALTLAFKTVGEKVWDRVGVEPSGSAFNSLVQLEYERGIPRNPLLNAGAIVVCDILAGSMDDPKFRLLANLMKSFGNIHHNIDTVLDVYFHLCSIEMTCKELAQTFLFLAAGGVSPSSKATIVSPRQTKRINSVMQMCGFYDEAGEFAYSTGLPGKSGVGGGIVAVLPGQFSIAVWSPKLNKKGNSYKGMKLLELVTTKTQSSIF